MSNPNQQPPLLSKETSERRAALLEEIKLKEQQIKIREELPHLYGWKWYPWAREFFESRNKKNLLCAANQISKSSTQIRKCIDWATNAELWAELWARPPSQFWYFYPTSDQVDIEFEEKWKQFLPRGSRKTDERYGWKEEKKDGKLFAIHFNSGVSVYFKTYSKKGTALQTGTVDAIFADEEMPVTLLDELMLRLTATDGYFHMVFTATIGQEFWRLAMEPGEGDEPTWADAAKWQVSMYDCLYYDDFTRSFWTIERIQQIENNCQDEHEIARRVHGKFVLSKAGLKYPTFDIKKHVKVKHPLPASWLIYTGVDLGTGGSKNHPAAIVFIGVNPEYTEGRVFLGWRGDGEITTDGDVLDKYRVLRGKLRPVLEQYDWAAADFGILADRAGEGFVKAEKRHEIGEPMLRTLFKKDMLFIYRDEQLAKLVAELLNLKADANKRSSATKDNFTDALRYAVAKIPWNWDAVIKDETRVIEEKSPLTIEQREMRRRRGLEDDTDDEERRYRESIDEEIAEWNSLYEA